MLFYIDDSDPLSSVQASLHRREAGRKKKKARGTRWEGEKEKPFPLPIVPLALAFFFFIAIFIGIAIGSLCGGERAIIRISLAAICPSGPCNNCSLIFVHSNPAFINAGS